MDETSEERTEEMDDEISAMFGEDSPTPQPVKKHIIKNKHPKLEQASNIALSQLRDGAVAGSAILAYYSAVRGLVGAAAVASTISIPAVVSIGIVSFLASKGLSNILKKHVIKKRAKKGEKTQAHLAGATVAGALIVANLNFAVVPTVIIASALGASALISGNLRLIRAINKKKASKKVKPSECPPSGGTADEDTDEDTDEVTMTR